MSVEELSEIAMNVITYSGVAKSCYIEGFRSYKNGDKERYKTMFDEGDRSHAKAHNSHCAALTAEVNKNEPQISLLLTHAEDQLMAAETMKTIFIEVIDLFEERRGV